MSKVFRFFQHTFKLCLHCVKMDTNHECDGNMQPYRVFGQIYQNGRRLLCKDPPGSCAWLACQCDVNMGKYIIITSTSMLVTDVDDKNTDHFIRNHLSNDSRLLSNKNNLKWQQLFWQHWEVTNQCIGDIIRLVVMQLIEIIYLNQINVVENIQIGMYQKYCSSRCIWFHKKAQYFWFNKDFHIILMKNSVAAVSYSTLITPSAVQPVARYVDLENAKYQTCNADCPSLVRGYLWCK